MKVPNFGAASSLGKPTRAYRSHGHYAGSDPGAQPSLTVIGGPEGGLDTALMDDGLMEDTLDGIDAMETGDELDAMDVEGDLTGEDDAEMLGMNALEAGDDDLDTEDEGNGDEDGGLEDEDEEEP